MSSSFRAPLLSPSDEIDLVALVKGIWQQKMLVLLMTFVVGFIAAAYAFLATPEFQVSSILRPAAINELDALNRSEIYKLPPGDALIKVGAALESYDTRLGFFKENQKLFKEFERPGRTLEQSFEEFNRNSISLILPDAKRANSLSAYIKLEMNYPEGVDGVSILNDFIEYAISSERQHISADIDVIVKNRLAELSGKLEAARTSYNTTKEAKIASLQESDALKRAQLQDELKALRNQLRTQRSNRMDQLSEAIGIAKTLGIRKPTTPSSLGDADRTSSATVMRTEVNGQQIPLYFMGVEALEAERSALAVRKSDDFVEGRIAQISKELQLLQANREVEVLTQRKNDDLFLAGVEPLRAEVVRLRNLNIDMANLKLVAIDKQALEPLSPLKPKKSLAIALGLMVGLLLGLVLASIRYAIHVRRDSESARLRTQGIESRKEKALVSNDSR
ncbi:Wzz/FepE/Etk N-terminal domain-containing protein [Pseudomonas sp. AU8050]|uniref:Wzz/FepE/Etk N-terminal domain-containing protein n=1 Tax=Pseudomonas sp. AU8050 TaxID=2681497 RepID=UPI00140C59DA|nr:chain-length determining protein [Pseudomonas sp. AU8050]